MADYEELVNRCASGRLDLVITNGSAVHARYLIKKLFDVAEQEVVIYSGDLAPRRNCDDKEAELFAWPELVSSAKRFVAKKGAVLKIVMQHPCDTSKHPFIAAITDNERQAEVSIYTPNSEDTLSDISDHFMVVDKRAFRLEEDDHNVTATGNFNGPDVAKKLHDAFTNLVEFMETYGDANIKKLLAA